MIINKNISRWEMFLLLFSCFLRDKKTYPFGVGLCIIDIF